MKWFFLSFLTFLTFKSLAQSGPEGIESSRGAYKIDTRYFAGKYLIYDCERKHYACVDLAGHSKCKEMRQSSIENKSKLYPCAPLSAFDDKKSCVEKSYNLVELNTAKRFCYPQ
jgi:hypothetical protein